VVAYEAIITQYSAANSRRLSEAANALEGYVNALMDERDQLVLYIALNGTLDYATTTAGAAAATDAAYGDAAAQLAALAGPGSPYEADDRDTLTTIAAQAAQFQAAARALLRQLAPALNFSDASVAGAASTLVCTNYTNSVNVLTLQHASLASVGALPVLLSYSHLVT
jgi:hypothetical protein